MIHTQIYKKIGGYRLEYGPFNFFFEDFETMLNFIHYEAIN